MYTLAVLLLEADEAAIEANDGAHEAVPVGTVAPLVLFEALDFEEEGLLFGDLGRREVEQFRRILLALDLAG